MLKCNHQCPYHCNHSTGYQRSSRSTRSGIQAAASPPSPLVDSDADVENDQLAGNPSTSTSASLSPNGYGGDAAEDDAAEDDFLHDGGDFIDFDGGGDVVAEDTQPSPSISSNTHTPSTPTTVTSTTSAAIITASSTTSSKPTRTVKPPKALYPATPPKQRAPKKKVKLIKPNSKLKKLPDVWGRSPSTHAVCIAYTNKMHLETELKIVSMREAIEELRNEIKKLKR